MDTAGGVTKISAFLLLSTVLLNLGLLCLAGKTEKPHQVEKP